MEGLELIKHNFKALEDFTKDSSITLLNPIKRTALEEELSEKGKTIFETKDKRSFEIRDRYIEMIEVIFND